MTASPVRRATTTLRGRLPAPVIDAARSAMLGLGELTARARMQPGLLIVGGQRCGTTTMYRLLSQHPDLVRPTASKGIGYFDLNYERGSRWYRAHFPLDTSALLRRSPQQIAFESSGYYSFHPLAAERIGRDLPGVKVVILVRDPVERAYSAHKHEARRGFEDLDFETALEMEPQRLEGEVERIIADPSYESFEHRHHAYVGRGEYADQIERFQRAVGVDNVVVVDSDEFFADPRASFGELSRRLGLTPWLPEEVGKENATTGADMPEAIRRRLEDHFEPFDERLGVLMGTTPSWRR